jgi:iron complex transport system substrate-binding protein
MATHRAAAGRRASRVLVALVLFTACRRSTPAAARVDVPAVDGGRSAPPPDGGRVAEARRVVALTPDITETLLALGARDRLVGVASMEAARPAIDGVARVGSQVAPDMAALSSARPDLVLVGDGPVGSALTDARAAGLAVEPVSFEGRARYAQSVAALAQRLGRPAAGAALLGRIDRELAAVRRRSAGAARPTVVVLLNREPMIVAGPGGYLDELIDAAGGRNAAANASRFPIVGPEMVVAWGPDVLVDLTPGAGAGVEALIPGLVTRRVVALSPDGLLRPGPHAGEAAGRLYDALHPR